MSIYKELIEKKQKLAVVGLGYVGMPIAIEFAKKIEVIGFDTNEEKIKTYQKGIDPTNEVGNESIKETNVYFTSNSSEIKNAKFIIIAVPTPINIDKTPDLEPVIKASEIVGKNLQKGAIVVYESTVYPGVTEDICMPILEKESGMKCGKDFKIGYSPERINPGDKEHRLKNITKIVSGMDNEALDEIAKTYEMIIEAGVHKSKTIKVAEAAKVLENSQRDINIAFMNEVAIVLNKMNIDTKEVIEAMNTKWNALKFYPGLVGGHCIGVDPYYFIYQAENLGYHSQIIASGRKINDYMGEYVAEQTIKRLILNGKLVKNAKIAILGITFKENCPDIRNSKVMDIIEKLKEYGVEIIVADAEADERELKREYGIDLVSVDEIKDADCLILAVSHENYKNMKANEFDKMYKDKNNKILIDVKGCLNKDEFINDAYDYWRL